MRAERNIFVCLVALFCLAAGSILYLRHEQRVELERYQLGYAQGLEIGGLRQREEFKKNWTCYRITDSGDIAGVVICGVMVSADRDGNPVEPSAADQSDLEQ
ncbi:MAG: hypothetical protein ACJ71S_06135 [Acidobacteriaceae bacterium]|jgi:hypothetical protein